MPLTVLLDACVLYPLPLRDTLLRIAAKQMYRFYYSLEILDEVTRNLVKKGRMDETKASRLRDALLKHFPEGLVENIPHELINILTNDEKDRHVLAAAISAPEKVTYIVTSNLKDFKPKDLSSWGIQAISPDEFLLELLEEFTCEELIEVLEEQVSALKKPPIIFLDFLEKLEKSVPRFVSEILLNYYGEDLHKILGDIMRCPAYQHESSFEGEIYRIYRQDKALILRRKEGALDVFKAFPFGRKSGHLTVDDVRRVLAVNVAEIIKNSTCDTKATA